MVFKEQKNRIIQFAKEQTAENDPYHGIDHLEETADIAVELAKAEGADVDMCWVAGMLHDICKGKHGDHGTEGAIKSEEFLLEAGFDKSFAERVKDAVHYHNKGFGGGPLERQIIWDADKLPLMNPEGFKKRMIPFWIMRLGRKEGLEKSIYEYYFYKKRFHTETAKKEAEKHMPEMESYFRTLKGQHEER